MVRRPAAFAPHQGGEWIVASENVLQVLWTALYFGVSPNPTLTAAEILTLDGTGLSESRAHSFTADATGGRYVYYVWSADLGPPDTVRAFGLTLSQGADYILTTQTLTTAAGHTMLVHILRLYARQTLPVQIEVT